MRTVQPITIIKGFLPVAESFGIFNINLGFTEYLRAETSGQAFPNCSFHHWEEMTENPLATSENRVVKIVTDIRKRKGLKPEIPPIDNFRDKL
jgi:elongation factor 2